MFRTKRQSKNIDEVKRISRRFVICDLHRALSVQRNQEGIDGRHMQYTICDLHPALSVQRNQEGIDGRHMQYTWKNYQSISRNLNEYQ